MNTRNNKSNMRSWIEKKASRLHDNDRGSSAVEFAMVAPLFVLIVMGIIEISLVMHAQSVMEGAAYDASRRGKTGYVNDNSTREQTIIDALNSRADKVFNVEEIHVTSTSYDQFDQIGQPEPFVDANGNGIRDDGENYTDVNGNGQYDEDMGSTGAGSATQVVVYTITYPWKIKTPIMKDVLGDNGIYNLYAKAVVQNEPF